MPGGRKALVAINGREIADYDPDQTAVSLSYVRVVPALRKPASGTAESFLCVTGARGRLLFRDSPRFIEGTTKAGAARKKT